MAIGLQGVNTVSMIETQAGGSCGVDRLATVGGWGEWKGSWQGIWSTGCLGESGVGKTHQASGIWALEG